ncbi:hypothetical protein STEG23_011908, partial [Scotinomys teguina]
NIQICGVTNSKQNNPLSSINFAPKAFLSDGTFVYQLDFHQGISIVSFLNPLESTSVTMILPRTEKGNREQRCRTWNDAALSIVILERL